VNGELPLVVAAGGGSALLAAVYGHERHRDEAMRRSRVRFSIRFPTGLDPLRAHAVLDNLSGLLGSELIAEVSAADGVISHALWVPAAVRGSVEATLRGVMPSVRIEQAAWSDYARATASFRVFIPTPVVLHSDGGVESSRALLAGLATLHAGERVVVRWAFRAGGPRRLPVREPQTPAEKEADRAWRHKLALPGMRAAGVVLVRTGSITRARTLAGHVENVIRARRGVAGVVRVTSERGNRTLASLPRTTGSSGWLSSAETLAVIGWPLGLEQVAGIQSGSRELLVPRHVPRDGRRLFIGRDATSGANRPVALDVRAASRHLALFGGTGAGKSSLLGRVILDAIAAGHGGVLLDPKDLAGELIDRVPPEHADRVVIVDPAAPGPAIGFDLFGAGDPYLRSDVILAALRALSDSWGPRIDQHLRMGLQTVATLPQPVLSDWLELYRDPLLRREAIARLDDPFLVAEWRTFEESRSAAEQFQHTAPAISRINNLLARPALRATLNQREPQLNLGRLLEEGRWALVALNPGAIGEPAARLLGAVLAYLTWQVIEARVALPPALRRPAILALDELQSLASLPVGMEAFFERARSMNCSVVAATQTTGRLPESLRGALLGNVGSLVSFRAGHEEAMRLSRELPGLTAQDLMALGRFEVAARIAIEGAGAASAIVTGHTEPLPPFTGQGRVIREASARDYGQARDQTPPQSRPPGQPLGGMGQIGSSERAS
jgi:hypothetical protein